MDSTDEELLRQYAREGSDAAFRELVRRHANLVYSAAKRQLRSDALATDVTQSVFTDLAKAAPVFKSSQPVIAWLHQVARRTAIDFLRKEIRRQAREHTAAELAAMNSSPSPWTQVEPLLDEAMGTLAEADRHALLLRYFENKSLRQVGEILGTSDDAAQKRVARAVEQLRGAFLRRGIAVSAAGLVMDLSAQALGPEPAGLVTLINTNAIPAATLPSTTLLTQSAAMTAVNKTLVAASVVLFVGMIYQAHLLSAQRGQLVLLEQRFTESQGQIRQLNEEQDRATLLLATKQPELKSNRIQAAEGVAMEAELESWLGRVNKLKDWLQRMPEKNIPEMQFLGSSDWLAVALNNDLETEAKRTLALANLRRMAKFKPEIFNNIPNAIRAYSKDHAGHPATEIAQLRPYLNPPLDDKILQRYEFIPVAAAFWPERPATNGIGQSTLMEKTVVDEDYDILAEYSDGGVNFRIVSKLGAIMSEATSAFMRANKGQEPTAVEQLLPYVATSVDQAKFKEFWEARRK
jgi:RNA polymerase sigma factor (sigma-70 family)